MSEKLREFAKCLWYYLRVLCWCYLLEQHQWVIITDSHVIDGQIVPHKHERVCGRCGEVPPVAPGTWYSCIGGVWTEHKRKED